MIYVEVPDQSMGNNPSIFLAGGITGCEDWQQEAVHYLSGLLDVTVFNPRHRQFDLAGGDAAAVAQIEWEWARLRAADVILFWFPASPGPQPIALHELGYAVASGQQVAVGCDPGYPRRLDVVTQLRLAKPDLRVWSTLSGTCLTAAGLLPVGRGRGRDAGC